MCRPVASGVGVQGRSSTVSFPKMPSVGLKARWVARYRPVGMAKRSADWLLHGHGKRWSRRIFQRMK